MDEEDDSMPDKLGKKKKSKIIRVITI